MRGLLHLLFLLLFLLLHPLFLVRGRRCGFTLGISVGDKSHTICYRPSHMEQERFAYCRYCSSIIPSQLLIYCRYRDGGGFKTASSALRGHLRHFATHVPSWAHLAA